MAYKNKTLNELKSGDILCNNSVHGFPVFAVYSGYGSSLLNKISVKFYITKKQILNYIVVKYKNHFHYANAAELQEFYNILKDNYNKVYDLKEKQLFSIRNWKPKLNEDYYSVEIDEGELKVLKNKNCNSSYDKRNFESGNCFKYKERALHKLYKIKNIFKSEF